MTHSVLLLILDALAVFRITRLVIDDSITAPMRDLLIGHTLGHTRDLQGNRPNVAARPRWAEFLTCPWCVGFWAAVLVVTAQSLIAGVWFYAACVLAFSAVTGIVAGLV